MQDTSDKLKLNIPKKEILGVVKASNVVYPLLIAVK